MTTYAVLSPPDGSTLHSRERRFAADLCDQLLYLTPGSLDEEPDGEIGDLTPTELANAVYTSTRGRDWNEDDEMYILVEPALLDIETRNAFRRSLRVVFQRFDPEVCFPYDVLEDVGKRAAWLTDSLEAGEIVRPGGVRRQSVTGVDEGQTDLTSF
ncbi:hypothetical protein [Haloferax sulfurifontis]|uniref:Uncharacterized protein n=1 Tax=Haloferax sulfurifontis ATCC BAA-897 TaxID=662480 RepID=M0HYS8_9EURY|nr:hypothetical protein [Haloferax sulfurifontis]ELZ89755.1 hypothetical protein C441_15315 [Haloferax sulfurifontis ATCC BAA-897]